MKFSEKVYRVVSKIPKGKTLTYMEVARRAGSPRAYRAVGNILNHNPYPISKVPCHRVVRTGGALGGYNKGVRAKTALLRKEGAVL